MDDEEVYPVSYEECRKRKDSFGFWICPYSCQKRLNIGGRTYYAYHYMDRCKPSCPNSAAAAQALDDEMAPVEGGLPGPDDFGAAADLVMDDVNTGFQRATLDDYDAAHLDADEWNDERDIDDGERSVVELEQQAEAIAAADAARAAAAGAAAAAAAEDDGSDKDSDVDDDGSPRAALEEAAAAAAAAAAAQAVEAAAAAVAAAEAGPAWFSITRDRGWDTDGREGSATRWRKKLPLRAWPNNPESETVLQLIGWVVLRLVNEGLSRAAIDAVLSKMRNGPGPGVPNNIPPSFKVIKGILGAGDMWDSSLHVCPCGLHRYPYLPKAEWVTKKDDTCPKCSRTRFVPDTQGRLTPRHWVFYLGIKNAVKHLMADPDFAAARGKRRKHGADPDYKEFEWYGCKYARDVNSRTDGALFTFQNSAYSLFIDGFNARSGSPHSIWVVFLRCEDLDNDTRSKAAYHVPIMVIPGPKKPKFSRVYMSLIAEEFLKYGPASSGFTVTPAVEKKEDGVIIRGRPFQHRVLLAGIDADSPAQWFVGEFTNGAGAYNGCHYCKFNGVHVVPTGKTRGKMHYAGYKTAVEATHGMGKGMAFKLGEDAGVTTSRHYTHEEQCERAAKLTNATISTQNEYDDLKKEWGCTGLCIFVEKLNYVDYNYLRRVPVSHILLFGLVKSFWRAVLRWKAGGERKSYKDCNPAIALPDKDLDLLNSIFHFYKDDHEPCPLILTSDFNKLLNFDNIGTFSMEQWARFLEVTAAFFQKDTIGVSLPSGAQYIWDRLRFFVLHHLRPLEENWSVEERSRAQKCIVEAAQYIEEHAPEFLIHNWHKAVCFFHVQERWCGLLGFLNEIWGERAIRPLKRICANARQDPAHVLANAILLKLALSCLCMRYGVDADAIFEGVLTELFGPEDGVGEGDGGEGDGGEGAAGGAVPPPGAYDDVSGDVGMQGPGRVATDDERIAVVAALKEGVIKNGADLEVSWAAPETINDLSAAAADLQIFIHTYAVVHGRETTRSTSFARSRTRDSSHVVVRFTQENGAGEEVSVPYIGKIEYYARIFKGGTDAVLRVALCRFYRQPGINPVVGNEMRGIVYRCSPVYKDPANKETWTMDSRLHPFPVLLSQIDGKVVQLDLPSRTEDPYYTKLCVTYTFRSMV